MKLRAPACQQAGRIKFCGGRQFSASLPAGRQGNRQLLVAAKRQTV